MEVKINKDIREYAESMFFGLSARQFFFGIAAIIVAVLLYFVLKPLIGMETTSWLCIVGAAPFAAMGFVKYHGLTAEKFLWVWFRSELLEPKQLVSKPTNLYFELCRESLENETKLRHAVKGKEEKSENEDDKKYV